MVDFADGEKLWKAEWDVSSWSKKGLRSQGKAEKRWIRDYLDLRGNKWGWDRVEQVCKNIRWPCVSGTHQGEPHRLYRMDERVASNTARDPLLLVVVPGGTEEWQPLGDLLRPWQLPLAPFLLRFRVALHGIRPHRLWTAHRQPYVKAQ